MEEEFELRLRAKAGLERKPEFKTPSGIEIKRFYAPWDLGLSYKDYHSKLGDPGSYPFTRGVYPSMYRGKFWTMRMFSGFGSPRETNLRWKYLINHGQTGLSTAFDYPTLLGYDSDHPNARGEVGKCGVAVSRLEDMHILFEDIPLDRITVSFTINAPTQVILGMYFLVAQNRGYSLDCLGGTTQNDMLKEFIAQKSAVVPPRASLKLSVDVIEYCSEYAPRWHPVSISGYHIREAGANAIQELAWTLANGLTYLEACLERGMHPEKFLPRFSFFFNAHNNFFEEIAKLRAARRLWARILREEYNIQDQELLKLKMHLQTAGCTLTAQQPELNIIRVAYQALAGVLGGVQSLHTNSYDEALWLPSEHAARIAILTQQILAYETGVADVVDPLGGSYFVESLTDEIEARAYEEISRIRKMGGVLSCIESGYYLREIAKTAAEYEKRIDSGEIKIVGVNCFQEAKPLEIPEFRVDPELERIRIEELRKHRAERDKSKLESALNRLERASLENENCFAYVMDAIRAKATLGEIMDVFRSVYGSYQEPPVY